MYLSNACAREKMTPLEMAILEKSCFFCDTTCRVRRNDRVEKNSAWLIEILFVIIIIFYLYEHFYFVLTNVKLLSMMFRLFTYNFGRVKRPVQAVYICINMFLKRFDYMYSNEENLSVYSPIMVTQ